MGEGIATPSSLGRGDRLLDAIGITNQSVQHAEHLKQILLGGHSILFDLRFFAAIFLFDDCDCRPLFLVGGLPPSGGHCRGRFIVATATLVVECPGLDQLVDPLAVFVSEIATL